MRFDRSPGLGIVYGYSAYGETQALGVDGDIPNNANQYTARENDGLVGGTNGGALYYYRARYYDPALKRFVADDPIGLRGGTNFNSFVANNPISRTDPLGLAYVGNLGIGGSFGWGTGSGFGVFYGWALSVGLGFSECEIRVFGQVTGSEGKGYGAYAGAGLQAGGGYSEGLPQDGLQQSFQVEGMGGFGPSLGGQVQVNEGGVSATGAAGRYGGGFGLAVTASNAYTLTKTLLSLPNPFGGNECACR